MPVRLARCLALMATLLLAACGEAEQAAKPPPQTLTRDAIGHYCQMIVADHLGPKAQLFLRDVEAPVWFTSVRDAIAFTLLPGEPKTIAAIYVTDMAKVAWDSKSPDAWLEAEKAYYVIGSEKRGGMGALETVPFGDAGEAEAFAKAHGGQVVAYADMPSDYVLNADTAETEPHGGGHDHGQMSEMPNAGKGVIAAECCAWSRRSRDWLWPGL